MLLREGTPEDGLYFLWRGEVCQSYLVLMLMLINSPLGLQ